MLSLTEKVYEVMERQEEAPAKKEQAAEVKQSYKIPTDLSVSTLDMLLQLLCNLLQLAVKQLHENSPTNMKFDGKEV